MTDPIVLPIPTPPVPLDIGRDNYADGVLGSGRLYSTVRVINLTPHATSEIKTSVITLEQDAFPISEPGFNTTHISVNSIYGQGGYVQWEPMGDIYTPTVLSPLGSYKTLRVKWDCRVPAGVTGVPYTTTNSEIPGPYEYYSEILYDFVQVEPVETPSFTLTPGVLRALGQFDPADKLKFQFSAHGYVNEFDLDNGLYGQDKLRDYPDGSGLIPAFRDPIYTSDFNQIPTTDRPNSQGQQCLAKEFELHGRIVPELDVSTAYFDPVTWDSSGGDAPPLWYNFFYELQHEKNVIPFTFMWGPGLVTYDDGEYNPDGIAMDYKDIRQNHQSTNHGPRLRSQGFFDYVNENFPQQLRNIINTPNVFYSNQDVTFSVVGPEIACNASSVNVCAVQSDTYNGLNRTIINWFDKANADIYDIDLYAINNLPTGMCWVLRGVILINESYNSQIQLSQQDRQTQQALRLEKTWAIDINFAERKLFGTQKNTMLEPPQALLDYHGFANSYQTASYHLYNLWESPERSNINVRVFPESLRSVQVPQTFTIYDENRNPVVIDLSNKQNPYFGLPSIIQTIPNVGFLKGLHEPFAKSPLGLDNRPGVAGSQPGFANVGGAGVNAAIGHPDMRAWEAAIDLEWNRLCVEHGRDGSLINQFDEPWKLKRFYPISTSISNVNLTNVGKVITGDPNYSFQNRDGQNTPYLSGLADFIGENSIFCYFGSNPTYGGSSNKGFGKGFSNASNSLYRKAAAKREPEFLLNLDFTNNLTNWDATAVTVVNNSARFSSQGIIQQSYTYPSNQTSGENINFRLDLDIGRYSSGSITASATSSDPLGVGDPSRYDVSVQVTPSGTGKIVLYFTDPSFRPQYKNITLTIKGSSDADFDIDSISFRKIIRFEQTKNYAVDFARYGLGSVESSSVDAFDAAGNPKTYSIPYFSKTEATSPFGHPQCKKQTDDGSPGYPEGSKYKYSTGTRQAFTNSHSAYSLQLSYAIASGDKITMRLIDHYMRILMCSHDYYEPTRILFCKESHTNGQSFQKNGRQEGRPLQVLLGGISITKDFKLKEQAVYYLARRYMNAVQVSHWEDYPFGVPDKPWIPITFPQWACVAKDINVINGIPEISSETSGVALRGAGGSWSTYATEAEKGGDFYYRKYAPTGVRLSQIAPNIDRNNVASWNAFAVENAAVNFQDQQIYANPFYRLDTRGTYIAPVRVTYTDGTQDVRDGVYSPLASTYVGDPLSKAQRLDDPFSDTNRSKMNAKVVSIPQNKVISRVEPIYETNGFLVSGDEEETKIRMFVNVNKTSKVYDIPPKIPVKPAEGEFLQNVSLTSLDGWNATGNITQLPSGGVRIRNVSYIEQDVTFVNGGGERTYVISGVINNHTAGTLKISAEGTALRRPVETTVSITQPSTTFSVFLTPRLLRDYRNQSSPIVGTTLLRFTGINADFELTRVSLKLAKSKPGNLIQPKFANLPYTQSYQNGLYFPYINALPVLFDTYSKVYAARATAGLVPEIDTRFGRYDLLSQEYADITEIMRSYFIRAAKAVIINSIATIRSNNPLLDGQFAMKYFAAASSYRKPFENLTAEENELPLDDSGKIITSDLPYAGPDGLFSDGKSWSLGTGVPLVGRDAGDSCDGEYERLQFFSKSGLMGVNQGIISRRLVAQGYESIGPCDATQILGSVVKDSGYGTKVWAAIAYMWAWKVLEDYATKTAEVIQLQEKARKVIEDFIGSEPFSLENYTSSDSTIKNSYEELYNKKCWGTLGWPSPGNSPPNIWGNLGDDEFMPNLVGGDGDLWRARESGIKFLENLRCFGSSELNTDIDVIKDPVCVVLLEGTYVGSTSANADIFRSQGSVDKLGTTRDLGGDSYAISVPGFTRDQDTVEINVSRSINGVANIDTTAGMEFGYYGLGYVHAKDMGDVCLLRYILHSGRGLDYFDDDFPENFRNIYVGSIVPWAYKFNENGMVDFSALTGQDSDAFEYGSLSAIALTQHLGNMIEDAQTYFEEMPDQYRQSLIRYVEGFNRGIVEFKDRHTASGLVGYIMDPLGAFDFKVTPVDVLLTTHWFTKNGILKNTKRTVKDYYIAPSIVSGGGVIDDFIGYVNSQQDDSVEDIPMYLKSSNQWAVHGSRSTTGKPIHMIDPHLSKPILGDYGFHLFLASIRADNFEFFGGGPVGTLFMALGGNYDLSWSLTANSPLQRVMYRIPYNQQMEFTSSRTSTYIPFETKEINISTKNGPITVPVKYSTHGVVLSLNENTNEAITLAHNFRGANQTLQFMEMANSRTLAEFNTYYGKMHSIGYNCLVATNEEPEGHIQYCLGGRVRKMQDEETYDLRSELLDGTIANTDWINNLAIDEISYNDDATYYAFSANELPVLVDPAAGYLVCNNAYPSMVTLNSPLVESNYPKSIVTDTTPPNINRLYRQARARQIFDAAINNPPPGQTTTLFNEQALKNYSLDNVNNQIVEFIQAFQSLFNLLGETYYGGTNTQAYINANELIQKLSSWDGISRLDDTHQAEYYYLVNRVYLIMLNSGLYGANESILEAFAQFYDFYNVEFASKSINPPGQNVEVYTSSIFVLPKNLTTPGTLLVSGIDYEPTLGTDNALNSQGYSYVVSPSLGSSPLFINNAGIIFNIFFTGRDNAPPQTSFRVCAPCTTYRDPITGRFAESWAQTITSNFAQGNYLDGHFSGLSVGDTLESNIVYKDKSIFEIQPVLDLSGLGFADNQFALSSTISLLYSGESELDSVVTRADIKALVANLDLSGINLQVFEFLREVSLPAFNASGESEFDGDFNKYLRLPSAEFSFSTSADANLDKITGIYGSLSGSTQLSGLVGQVKSVSVLFSGSTELDGRPDTPNLLLLYSGQTQLSSVIDVYNERSSMQEGFVSKTIDRPLELSDIERQIKETEKLLSERSFYKFEQNLWTELTERTKNDEKVSEIYRDTLEYLISTFSEIVYIDDENNVKEVPCWHGTMDRLVAKLKKEANTILPVISVFRSGNAVDQDRRRNGSLIVYERYWDTEKNRAVRVASLPPVPINIQYKINVWTKYQEDMDHITEQVHRMFNPDIEINTKNNSTAKAYLADEAGEVPTTVADGQNRIIRKVFTISVESYVPSPKFVITNTGRVEHLSYEVYVPITRK